MEVARYQDTSHGKIWPIIKLQYSTLTQTSKTMLMFPQSSSYIYFLEYLSIAFSFPSSMLTVSSFSLTFFFLWVCSFLSISFGSVDTCERSSQMQEPKAEYILQNNTGTPNLYFKHRLCELLVINSSKLNSSNYLPFDCFDLKQSPNYAIRLETNEYLHK